MKYWRFCSGEQCKTLIPRYPSRRKYCSICAEIENRNKARNIQRARQEAKVILRGWNDEPILPFEVINNMKI